MKKSGESVKPRATDNPRRSDLKGRALYHARGLLSIVSALFLFLANAGTITAEQETLEGQAASNTIPVEEVATRSAEVADLLRTLEAQFTPRPEIEKIEKELTEASDRMANELRRTLKVLRGQPTLGMLQNQQQLWRQNQSELVAWLNLLTRRATHLQAALRQLGELYESWRQTLDAAHKTQAPQTVIQQIEAILPDIEAARKNLQTRHSAAIDLQSRIAEEVARCGEALDEISKAQQTVVDRIASRESRPIWHEDLWTQARGQGLTLLRDIAVDPWTDLRRYLREPSNGMPIHLGIFTGFSILFFVMRRRASQWSESEGSRSARYACSTRVRHDEG